MINDIQLQQLGAAAESTHGAALSTPAHIHDLQNILCSSAFFFCLRPSWRKGLVLMDPVGMFLSQQE